MTDVRGRRLIHASFDCPLWLEWLCVYLGTLVGMAGPHGICIRVSVCVTGHWLIGHYSHRKGGQSWIIDDVAAQGYNVGIAGLISMGESWHNNHHAYPGSARLGLLPGQIDLGWWLIKAFEAAGLAGNIKTPDNLAPRPGLRRVDCTGNARVVAPGAGQPRVVPMSRRRVVQPQTPACS